MCGIAGFVDAVSKDAATALLNRMASRLVHRGPDDQGAWYNEKHRVGLAHRRLSIIDLSPEGHQPMSSSTGRYVIAFNGEIYNFGLLREELEKLGVSFRGHSDTEVFLGAVEQWGFAKALERSTGMFAIAMVDLQEGHLYLARDRLGKKPLYVARVDKALAFASELKAIRAHPSFRSDVDRSSLAAFFRHNYVPGPYTIYQHAWKHAPGCYSRVNLRSSGLELEEFSYWCPRQIFERTAETSSFANIDVAVDALREVLSDAVQTRMRADVPLGAFLSGGVDSSLVVALMQSSSVRPVRTFTIGFAEQEYDETTYARQVAAHLGTDHVEHCVTPEEALAVVPRLPEVYDEPFADSSQIPTLLVSQLARQHVTVALSGDGGDEFFLGYSRYRAAEWAWQRLRWIPAPVRLGIARIVQRTSPDVIARRLMWLEALLPHYGRKRQFSETMLKMAEVMGYPNHREFYRAFVSHAKRPAEIVLNGREKVTKLGLAAEWPTHKDFVTMMGYMDAITYLPDDILVKVDRASMAFGLEARAPLLDHRVAEFAWSLPLKFKYQHGIGKLVLKTLLQQYVPASLIERPKTGFGIPLAEWLRGPLREWMCDTLSDGRIRRDGYLEPALVAQYVREHTSGKRDWQGRLWNLVMFCAWLDQQGSAPE